MRRSSSLTAALSTERAAARLQERYTRDRAQSLSARVRRQQVAASGDTPLPRAKYERRRSRNGWHLLRGEWPVQLRDVEPGRQLAYATIYSAVNAFVAFYDVAHRLPPDHHIYIRDFDDARDAYVWMFSEVATGAPYEFGVACRWVGFSEDSVRSLVSRSTLLDPLHEASEAQARRARAARRAKHKGSNVTALRGRQGSVFAVPDNAAAADDDDATGNE